MLVLAAASAPQALKFGALLFGAVVGWNAYFNNRYRQTVVVGDLGTLVSAIGAGAILKLFPAQSVTFGYYGVGLGLGFFLYLAFMLVLVRISKNATVDWLLGLQGRPTDQAGEADRPAVAPEQVDRPFSAQLLGKFRVPLPPL